MVTDVFSAISTLFDMKKLGVKTEILDHEDEIDFQNFLKIHKEAMENE